MYNIPVDKPFRVTQVFWVNSQNYRPQFPKGHPWIDYAGAKPWDKQSVYASRSGIVVQSHKLNWWGETIVIRHDDGMETIYAHLSTRVVKAWDKVNDLQYIWVTWTTWNSTGVHLHFWIRWNKSDPRYDKNNWYDGRLNPNDYLKDWIRSEKELIQQIITLNSKLYEMTSDPEIKSVTNVENIILRTKI